jgi:histidyl-tRNA synthetase
MKIRAIRGMKDISQPEIFEWQEIESTCREIFNNYGYAEVRTPIVEMTSLFSRSVGEDTDIVEKEMYTFDDRSGDSLSLRPEGTAGVVRAAVEQGWLQENPISKMYYIGPMFRHERPQKGRYRQFYQLGAEYFGIENPAADIEVLTMGCHFFQKIGLDEVTLKLNSIGCKECRPKYKELLIAKLEPIKDQLPQDFQGRLQTNPQRIFDHKDEKAQEIAKELPTILEHLCEACDQHFSEVRSGLENLGVPFVVDPKIVRGLDYYNRTAFEFVSNHLGAQSAVGGGGRYDGLVQDLGGVASPAIGFALGLERVVMLKTQIKAATVPPIDLFCLYPDADGLTPSMEIAYAMRRAGFRVEMDLKGRSMKAQMKRSHKLSSRFVLILGSQELANGKAILRDMSTQEQSEISVSEIAEKLPERIKRL